MRFWHGPLWVSFDGWRSDTVQDLFIEDLGIDQMPKTKTTAETIPGRDGFVLAKRYGFDSYERKVTFIAGTRKALKKLYRKLQHGQRCAFVFSNDPAFEREVFIKDIESEALNPNATRVTYTLTVAPFKTALRETVYSLAPSVALQNPGDTVGLPRFTITGAGVVTLSLDGQSLEVDLTRHRTLVIDSERLETETLNGEGANSSLRRGYFLTIPTGKSTLTITGANVKGALTVHWRYIPW